MKTYRNAERTKRWIRRAFTEMMAEKKDIEKISVTELAARADISKTTFYYHYEDIYAVAEEFENELIEQLSVALTGLAKDFCAESIDFEYYTRGIIAYLKENEENYRMVMSASSPRLFAEKLKKIIAKKVTESVPYVAFTSDPGKWQVQVCFVASACVDVVTEYYRGAFPVSFDTVAQVIQEIVHKLIATNQQTPCPPHGA